jgi:hypothetical protein
MGEVGTVYLNFGLWAISLLPAWFVVKEIGVTIGKIRDTKDADEVSNTEIAQDHKS